MSSNDLNTRVTRDFDAGAGRYDLLVGLNPGYHAHLDAAAATLGGPDGSPASIVDLGCGSGASTKALLRAHPDAGITGVDASSGMLDQAKAKSWPATVRFLHGRAGQLDGLLDQPVDAVLAAYLFRNVPADERDAALADTFAALRPGGRLTVLEYSVAEDRSARARWMVVSRAVIRPLARAAGGNSALYSYLEQSVLDFDGIATFADRLHRTGFVDVQSRTVPGWQRGILHLVRARRPQ